MFLHTLIELTERQLESIVGGTYYTWKCDHGGINSGSGSGSGSGGSSGGHTTYVHIGNSSNIGIISLNNIYIGDNSSLTIDFNQSAF